MKTLCIFSLTALMGASAFAQMAVLPPASTIDGVVVQPIGLNAGTTHWENTAGLGAFRGANGTDGTAPISTTAYNSIGLPFATSMPSAIQANLNTINANGGILRTIFLGESAQWRDSLGYTYSGNFAGPQSYTVFPMMEGNPSAGPVNVHFGDYFDLRFAVGTTGNFDLWFQGQGDGTGNGGDYTLFHPANSSVVIPPGNVLWAQQSLSVSTWIPALGTYMDITTYLVGLEDWRLDRGSDRDYTDTVLAFQFFNSSGTPFTPVPEPSTYGMVGAGALAALIALRRYSRKKQNA
ncbi:MAG: PEP-CTERM sorting domain-containing protein [Nibricoccus sp.]